MSVRMRECNWLLTEVSFRGIENLMVIQPCYENKKTGNELYTLKIILRLVMESEK